MRRHIAMVYSAASRMLHDSHAAEDVTQAVFMALSKKARSLGGRPVISGWLHRTTQNLAAQTVRSAMRRRVREQEAATMIEPTVPGAEDAWSQISSYLDSAVASLNEADRDALMLRYFENRSAREMARILSISEEAAQKRLSRAVERLRTYFAKQGITIGAATLVMLISSKAIQAVPVGLAGVIAAALSKATVTGTKISVITKAIAMTTLQKTSVATALLILGGGMVYQSRLASEFKGRVEQLQRQRDAQNLRQFQQEQTDVAGGSASMDSHFDAQGQNAGEILRLRGEVGRLRREAAQRENEPLEHTATAWANRANQVKQWLSQNPQEGIPELQLLSDRDWLEIVAPIPHWDGTNDFSFASSVLRTRAKKRMAVFMGIALGDYLLANNGQLPGDVSDLKQYFDPQIAVTEAMLQRYQFLHGGDVSSLPYTQPLISEIRAVQNGQYDALFKIGVSGYSYEKVTTLGETSGQSFRGNHQEELKRLFGSI